MLISQAAIAHEFGIPPSKANPLITKTPISSSQLQANFKKLGLTAEDIKPIDWRKKVNLVHVKNQKNCGDCWAQSSCSAHTDRFIIHKSIKNLNINPVLVTQCAPDAKDSGCGGGMPTNAGHYFETVGGIDSSSSCPSWNEVCSAETNCGLGDGFAGKNPTLPGCDAFTQKCMTGKPKPYYAVQGSTRTTTVTNEGNQVDPSGTIANMKKELRNGPYVVCYFVPRDFIVTGAGYKWSPTNGIFINGAYGDDLMKDDKYVQFGKKLGVTKAEEWADPMMEAGSPYPAAHAVEIVGWDIGDAGSYGRVPYWIIKNSWGPDWNEGGYFRVAMNDPTSTGKTLNDNLAIDVPVSSFTILSKKQRVAIGGLFGGGTAWDIKIDSGDDHGHSLPYKKPDEGGPGKDRSIIWKIFVGLILVGIVVLGILYGPGLWKKMKGKRGRSRGK